MTLLLVNERGIPQAPAAVVGRLRAIDPRLALRCYQWGVTHQWAVVWPWDAESDPRMARVQSGEIDPATAVDILGYLPLDAKPDDAVALVSRMLQSMESGGYTYVHALLEKVRNHNAQVSAGVWKPTLDRANETIETKASGLFAREKGRIAKSVGFGAGKKHNRRPGDPA